MLKFYIIYIYPIESYHLSELNKTNPLGMKGVMAEEFGSVIRNLWNGKYNWTNANRLRVCLIEIYWFYHNRNSYYRI